LYHAAAWRLLPHVLQSNPGNIDQAEEVDLHLLSDLLLFQLLEATSKTVSGIVDHNINATEFLHSLLECLGDGFLVCHIEAEAQVILLGCAFEFKLFWLASCCDGDVAVG
jgi:hypothetical protein